MELLNTRMFDWKEGYASGLANQMDMIILHENKIIYNTSFALAKTIFINTRLQDKLIIYFIDIILPILMHPVNVILAGEDYTFPNNTDLRMQGNRRRIHDFKRLGSHPMIHRLFVENLDEALPNTVPIPLGINPRECPIHYEYFLKYEKINPLKPFMITNFNRTRDGKGQFAERKQVDQLCETAWRPFFIHTKDKHHEDYLTTMGKYMFTLCVHGGGLDVNPKLWEALLIGVIPIIKENKPYTDLYQNLPVVILKEWDSDAIHAANLTLWHETYYHHFTDREKRKKMIEWLSLKHWVEYVKSFE
jgi:hypothetical protein